MRFFDIKADIKSAIVKNIGLYTLLNFFNASVPFLLLPILTNHLDKAQYGIMDIFMNMSFILMPVIGLNISASVVRFYFDKDTIDFPVFLYNIIFFIVCSGGSFIVLAGALVLFEINIFQDESIPYYLILLSILYVLFSQLCEVLLSLFRVEEKPLHFGLFRISKTIMDFGVSVLLIVIFSYGWEGRVYPTVLITCLFSILAVVIIKRIWTLNYKINKNYIKSALRYSSPLIFHGLGVYIISFSDRFLILKFLGIESVGIYAVAYQIGMIMSFVNTSFNQAWMPFLFSKLKEENGSVLKRLEKFNYIYFLLMVFIALGVYVMVPSIYKYFIGETFNVDASIVLWVLLGYALNGMYKMIVNYIFYFKKTTNLALYTMIAAVVNISGCYILLPRYGILGASVSTTIAFFVLFILVYIQYLRFFRYRKIIELFKDKKSKYND